MSPLCDGSSTVCTRGLEPTEQRQWIDQVREIVAAAPFIQRATGLRVTSAGRWGWTSRAKGYVERHPNGKPWPSIPKEWLALADEVAGKHPWDSAVINWYDIGASLGWHQDKSEANTSLPVVTISLGDACCWATRRDEHSPIERTHLGSGVVTLLSGETRNHFHAVERIIAEPLLSPIQTRGRISITIRVAGAILARVK